LVLFPFVAPLYFRILAFEKMMAPVSFRLKVLCRLPLYFFFSLNRPCSPPINCLRFSVFRFRHFLWLTVTVLASSQGIVRLSSGFPPPSPPLTFCPFPLPLISRQLSPRDPSPQRGYFVVRSVALVRDRIPSPFLLFSP